MTRVFVILLALVIDLTLGDPPNRFHPLLLMGRWLKWGRTASPQQHRFWFGASWTLAGLLLFTLPWQILKKVDLHPLDKSPNTSPTARPLFPTTYYLLPTAFLLKPVFAYRNLRRAVVGVARALAWNDLVEARRLLSWHLVSRDTSDLSAAEVAGAAIESLAENLTDSLIAPLLAYALGGLPAAWGYRFVNTADAMWGYRTPEFEQMGKFPARLDDLFNWLPARLAGWLLVAAAWLVGADAAGAKQTMLGQHGRTSSPNAGWTMSAMAGALGVTLSKRDIYELEGGQERLDVTAIKRALRLADVGAGLGVVVAIGVAHQIYCLRRRTSRIFGN